MEISRVRAGDTTTALSDGKVWLYTPYGQYEINSTFVDAFLHLMELPAKAINTNNPFTALYNSYTGRYPNIEVKIYVVDGHVLTILPHASHLITHKSFDVIASKLQDRYGKLCSIDQFLSCSFVSVFCDHTFRAFDGAEGLFQRGVRVAVPHHGDSAAEVDGIIRKLMNNGGFAAFKAKAHSKVSLNGETLKGVCRDLLKNIHYSVESEDPDLEAYLTQRLQSLRGTNSSLQELLDAAKRITDVSEMHDNEPFGIDAILDAYEIASPGEKSARWRKSAKTPISRWVVFDQLASLVSHLQGNERLELANEAGGVLTSTGDFEDLAPDIAWQ